MLFVRKLKRAQHDDLFKPWSIYDTRVPNEHVTNSIGPHYLMEDLWPKDVPLRVMVSILCSLWN
jgi:hypothetical protein